MIVCAILACCLKEKKRQLAVDGLLISATLFVVLTLSSNYILPPSKKPATAGKQAKAIKQCDSAVDSISESGYLKAVPEPARTIVTYLSAGNVDNERQDAEKIVQKTSDEYPDNSDIAARLAIILHSEGKDTEPIFKRFIEKEKVLSPLLQTLATCYRNSTSESAPTSDKLAATIKEQLPKGWYQKTALVDIYTKYDATELKNAQATDREEAEAWRFRILSFLCVDACLVSLGLASIIWFFRFKPANVSDFIPITSDFRRMYACLISTLFAQIIASFIFGLWLGITSALDHKPLDIAEHHSDMSATLIVSGAIFLSTLFYLLILRPQKLSAGAAFTRSAISLSPTQLALFALGGFCASTLLNMLGRFLYHLAPNSGRTTNPAQLDMVDAVVSGNVPMICWTLLFACIIAPITEEVMFRGLLQGWLRKKFGAAPAIIGNSLLFAFWHFDPNGFVQYFALGLSQSCVYNKTRNLWIAIIIHAMWNFWVMLTVFWVTSYHK